MPKEKVLNKLKEEIAKKLEVYEENYANENRVELSMYQEQFRQFDMNIEDCIQIGPYSGKELLESLELDPYLNQESKLTYLAMLSDAFLEKGFETNVYLPKRHQNGEKTDVQIEEKPLYLIHNPNLNKPKAELKLGAWDKFWSFFGIETENAKKVEALMEAQRTKKNEIQRDLKQKDLDAQFKITQMLNRNSKRIYRNEQLFSAKEAENSWLLNLFLDEQDKMSVEQRSGQKASDIRIEMGVGALTPQAYIAARVLKKKGIDISNAVLTDEGIIQTKKNKEGIDEEECLLSPEEMKAIGQEFYQIALDTAPEDRERVIRENLEMPFTTESEFYPEKKYIEATKNSVALSRHELGKIAAFSEMKDILNQTLNMGSGNKLVPYMKQLDENKQFKKVVERAEKVKEISDCLKTGKIEEAHQKAVSMVKEAVVKDYDTKAIRSIKNKTTQDFIREKKLYGLAMNADQRKKFNHIVTEEYLKKKGIDSVLDLDENGKEELKELKEEKEKVVNDRLKKELQERISDRLKAEWTPKAAKDGHREALKTVEQKLKGNGNLLDVTLAITENILSGREKYGVSSFHYLDSKNIPEMVNPDRQREAGLNFIEKIEEEPELEEEGREETNISESEMQEPESSEIDAPEAEDAGMEP